MSLPSFPNKEQLPSREEAINQIISSIAMEELGLSHIINAEGEKLQYALGTIPGVTGPEEPLTLDDLLELNKSINMTLDSAMMNQLFLKEKLHGALSASVMAGPTGPTGVTGIMEASGMQAALTNTGGIEVQIPQDGVIPFNDVVSSSGTDISYDVGTSIFTINITGLFNIYMINWWIFVEGSDAPVPVAFSLNVGGDTHITTTPWVEAQLSGSTLTVAGANPIQVTLTNVSGTTVNLPDINVQAQITIVGFRRVN